MKSKLKLILFWILAAIITLSAVIYQRRTGPTYDKRTSINVGESEYKLKLIRSHGGESDAKVELLIGDESISGVISFRRYPSGEKWKTIKLQRSDEKLVGYLPNLPPAGKYEYTIDLHKNNKTFSLNNGNPVIIRFKGDVPAGILVPHILFMFLAMLLGNLAGIMALFNYPAFKKYTAVTLLALFIGGLILGPWVQWHAFGEAWTGVPFAWDLTDNKTLVAFIFWLIAFLMNRKKLRPAFTVVAAVVMLIVYSIPHSMYGSELNPETGEIIQGWIHLWVP